jgi:hypothetical protein
MEAAQSRITASFCLSKTCHDMDVADYTIQNELKTQLSSWQFSEGKTDGIAQFPYKIERK